MFLALFCFALCLTVNIGKEMTNIDEESVLCVVLFKFLLCGLKETTTKIYEVWHTLSFFSVAFYFFEHVTSKNTKLTFINAFLYCSFLIIHSCLWGFVWVILVLLYLQSCNLFNMCNISHQVSCTYAEFSVCPTSSIS